MIARRFGLHALFALACACRSPSTTGDAIPTTIASGSLAPSAAPPDHLAPGELLAGAEQAFGVTLPRGAILDGSFVDVVYATAPFAVHPLVEYFRARLEDGGLREGPAGASFDHVKARGKPERELLVRITLVSGGTSIEIRDATPPAAPVLPNEPARWQRVGLTQTGRLADPTHLD